MTETQKETDDERIARVKRELSNLLPCTCRNSTQSMDIDRCPRCGTMSSQWDGPEAQRSRSQDIMDVIREFSS